jgi:hypothetical protein
MTIERGDSIASKHALEAPRRRNKKAERKDRALSHHEIFSAGNVGAEPSAKYLESLTVLDNVIREPVIKFTSCSKGFKNLRNEL